MYIEYEELYKRNSLKMILFKVFVLDSSNNNTTLLLFRASFTKSELTLDWSNPGLTLNSD